MGGRTSRCGGDGCDLDESKYVRLAAGWDALLMLLLSIVASVVLTVLLNLLLR